MAEPLILKNASSDEHDDTYPALQFERYFGLRDIGRTWQMPGGISMAAMERQLWGCGFLDYDISNDTILTTATAEQYPAIAMRFATAQQLATDFIDLNPDLRRVDFDPTHWEQIKSFILGVTSGFNSNDIQYWLKGGRRTPELEQLRQRIYSQCFNAPEQSWYPQDLKAKFNEGAYGLGPDVISLVHWVPCPQTIVQINTQLDQKDVLINMPSPTGPTS